MIEEWKTYKLGDVADVQNGFAFKSTDLGEAGVPVIKIKNIVSPNVILEGAGYYTGKLDVKLEKYILKRNDFLISMTGSTVNVMSSAVGKMGIYRLDDIALINQRVGKIYITDTKKADFNYVCHFLNRYEINYNLALNATGSANQANISPAQIKDIDILLPPLQEQRSIASILTAIDDKIELNLQMNKTLEEMAMTLYKHWFVDFGPFQEGEFVDSELGMIPKGWEVKKLGEICTVINGRAYKNEEFLEVGTPIIRIQNLLGGGKTVYSNLSLQADKYVESGDLIYAWSATFGPYIWAGPKSIYHYHIWKLNANADVMSKYYLFHHLERTSVQMKEHATGSIFTHLTKSTMENQKVILPASSIINKYHNLAATYHNSILCNKDETQTLTTLRDTLLPKLISGEVRVKEAAERFKELIKD